MGVGLHCVARHCPMPLADLPDSRRQDCRRCLAVGINRIKAMTALRLSKKPRADVADDCPSQGSRIHTRRNLHPFEPPRILQKCHSYFFLSSQSRPRSPPNRNSQYRTYSKSARFRLSPRYRRLRVNDALMWLDAAIIFLVAAIHGSPFVRLMSSTSHLRAAPATAPDRPRICATHPHPGYGSAAGPGNCWPSPRKSCSA